MSGARLSPLESAALETFALYAAQVPGLVEHLAAARLLSRENTGSGFLTRLDIDRSALSAVTCPSPLDGPAVVPPGMTSGLDLLLHFSGGYASLLEGYSIADEDVAAMQLSGPAPPIFVRHRILRDLHE